MKYIVKHGFLSVSIHYESFAIMSCYVIQKSPLSSSLQQCREELTHLNILYGRGMQVNPQSLLYSNAEESLTCILPFRVEGRVECIQVPLQSSQDELHHPI